jgi:opacity protein-like surface antigen
MRRVAAAVLVVVLVPLAAAAQEDDPQPLPMEEEGGAPVPRQPPRDEYQPPPPPPPQPEPAAEVKKWNKVYIGGSLGIGTIHADCTGCDEYDGISFGIDLGVPFGKAKRWSVVGDMWINAGGGDNDRAASLFTLHAGLRWWAKPEQIWLQATMGLTSLSEGPTGETPDEARGGITIAIAAGIELERWRHLALDLRARYGFGSVGKDADTGVQQTGVALAFTWY